MVPKNANLVPYFLTIWFQDQADLRQPWLSTVMAAPLIWFIRWSKVNFVTNSKVENILYWSIYSTFFCYRDQIRYVNICLGHWFYLQTCTFANFGPRRTSFFDGIESRFSPLWSHFLGFFLMKSIKFSQKHLNLQFFIILYTFWYKIAKF